MEIYIYTLSHPITNEVRYVGKTINVKRRYKQHLYDKRNSHKACWVKSLKNEGLKPIMTIVETCSNNWQEREIYWINQFDNLTNLKEGGGVDYNRTTSEGTKEKIRQANLGRKLTDKHKEKIKESTKNKINILIDGIEYESITEASRLLKIELTKIHRRLKSDKYPNYIRT
jgi:hypothetical protein